MKSIECTPNRTFFLVLDRGDEVIASLRKFAEEKGIRGGHFTAIGALERLKMAWWSWTAKEYERRDVEEQVEVLALVGDITVEGEETKIHAHIAIGRRDGIAAGGHLMEGIVRPTLEVHLVDYGRPLVRRKDEVTKLSLIALAEAE